MVNAQVGLERISAVWWGFWAVLAALMLGAAIFIPDASGRGELAAIGGGGILFCYVAHRLTCWIVAGFFGPRS